MRHKIKEAYLDGEKLYKYYFSMGQAASIGRLAAWAVSTGMARHIKPNRTNMTGMPHMGVWKAMWRWASMQEHRDEAFSIFADYVCKYGWLDDTDFPWPMGTEITMSDWYRFMAKKIRTAWQYAPNRHARFLRENGWV